MEDWGHLPRVAQQITGRWNWQTWICGFQWKLLCASEGHFVDLNLQKYKTCSKNGSGMTKSRWALNTFLRWLQSSHYSISHKLAKLLSIVLATKAVVKSFQQGHLRTWESSILWDSQNGHQRGEIFQMPLKETLANSPGHLCPHGCWCLEDTQHLTQKWS